MRSTKEEDEAVGCWRQCSPIPALPVSDIARLSETRYPIAPSRFSLIRSLKARSLYSKEASTITPPSNACDPLSSYFISLGSANLSGSRSDVMVSPTLFVSHIVLPAAAIVAAATAIAAVTRRMAPPYCAADAPLQPQSSRLLSHDKTAF